MTSLDDALSHRRIYFPSPICFHFLSVIRQEVATLGTVFLSGRDIKEEQILIVYFHGKIWMYFFLKPC